MAANEKERPGQTRWIKTQPVISAPVWMWQLFFVFALDALQWKREMPCECERFRCQHAGCSTVTEQEPVCVCVCVCVLVTVCCVCVSSSLANMMRQTPAPRKVQNSIWSSLSVRMLLLLLSSPFIYFVDRAAVKVMLESFSSSSFWWELPLWNHLKSEVQLQLVCSSFYHVINFCWIIPCLYMCVQTLFFIF